MTTSPISRNSGCHIEGCTTEPAPREVFCPEHLARWAESNDATADLNSRRWAFNTPGSVTPDDSCRVEGCTTATIPGRRYCRAHLNERRRARHREHPEPARAAARRSRERRRAASPVPTVRHPVILDESDYSVVVRCQVCGWSEVYLLTDLEAAHSSAQSHIDGHVQRGEIRGAA
jgi:hypothetical protein